jgi:hypothetical protein
MRLLISERSRRINFRFATFVAICFSLFSFSPPSALVSDTAGPSVDGNFEIESEEGPTRHIEFHARRGLDGTVSGETTFRDDVVVGTEKVKNAESTEASKFFFLKADFDCLVISKNKAVMSGAITESSSQTYVGRRVLVIAQDNGGATDSAQTDRLTWGVYHSAKKQWLASDMERPADEVSQLFWIASDFERPDDEGVPSDLEQIIGCQSFPLSSFSFTNPKLVHGSVRVRP